MPRPPYARDAERVFASSLGLGAVVEGSNLLCKLFPGRSKAQHLEPPSWCLLYCLLPPPDKPDHSESSHGLAPHFPPLPGTLLLSSVLSSAERGFKQGTGAPFSG